MGPYMAARVAVGTRNPVKVVAVERVLARYVDLEGVEPVRVDPGVPSQPVGFKQVLLGAFNRATSSRNIVDADYGVGVEAGPVSLAGIPLELQVAIVVDKWGRTGVGISPGFQLPSSVEARVLRGEELGSVFPAKRPGDLGEGIGVIGVLTRGGVTRLELTMHAVEMAILPLVNEGLYTPLTVEDLRGRIRAMDL